VFIGHLPAAYLLGHTVFSPSGNNMSGYVILIALIGGVIPDCDLVYFYTMGERQVVHHEYWTHIPFFWLVIYLIGSLAMLMCRRFRAFALLSVFFAAVVLHLLLDTITGEIQWLYPVSGQSFTLVQVPAVHTWWVANFIMHWTFMIELAVLVLALFET